MITRFAYPYKNLMKIRLTDGLNEGQLTAYNNITKWVSNKNDNSMWLLEGYA